MTFNLPHDPTLLYDRVPNLSPSLRDPSPSDPSVDSLDSHELKFKCIFQDCPMRLRSRGALT